MQIPRITVASIIEEQGRFLLVEEEADGGIVLNQPAGHLDPGESLLAAAARETLEETAWQFTPQALIGVYQYTNPNSGHIYVRFCFSGQHFDHQPQRGLDKGILRTLWLTREELAQQQDRHRSPLVLNCVDDYLRGLRYPLDILHVASL